MKLFNKKRNKKFKSKSGQEEIAGFAIILVVVAVILLAFLATSIKKSDRENLENYEVNNFLQAVLQQTTRCEMKGEYIDIKSLIFECEKEERCEKGLKACTELENTLRSLIEDSWKVGESENYLYTGYEMAIVIDEENNLIGTIADGRTAENRYGSSQDFAKAGYEVSVYFTVYYEN